MASLLQIASLNNSQNLKDRTLGAVLKKIPFVLAEVPPGEGAPQEEIDEYDRRQKLATTAATSPQMVRDRFFSYLLANTTIQDAGENCTDSDIEYVVDFHWSDVAKTI
jgi:hypothetical protein